MDNSSNNTNGKKRKSDELSSVDNSTSSAVPASGRMESITDVATHLHSLLQSKEKELAEREADFNRRVNLYEADHPSMGKDTDLLQLNVGGNCNIAVMRRTLTQFEDSVLAAQFSGRWDESMEKDRDGNIFIDQDPEQFLLLVNYLRLRMNNQSRQVPDKHLPKPTYSFCYMLEYYGLMPAVYPQSWIGNRDKFSCEEISYGTYVLSSTNNDGANDTEQVPILYRLGSFADAGVSEFTVEFEKGASGAVGWYNCVDNGRTFSKELNVAVNNSIYLNITERKIYGPNGVLQENMMIDNVQSTTKIICRHDGRQAYSVELKDDSPNPNCIATKTLVKSEHYSGSQYYRVLPMIKFKGKVTVSNLKYAIDEL